MRDVIPLRTKKTAYQKNLELKNEKKKIKKDKDKLEKEIQKIRDEAKKANIKVDLSPIRGPNYDPYPYSKSKKYVDPLTKIKKNKLELKKLTEKLKREKIKENKKRADIRDAKRGGFISVNAMKSSSKNTNKKIAKNKKRKADERLSRGRK